MTTQKDYAGAYAVFGGPACVSCGSTRDVELAQGTVTLPNGDDVRVTVYCCKPCLTTKTVGVSVGCNVQVRRSTFVPHDVPTAGTLHELSYCRACGAGFDDPGSCPGRRDVPAVRDGDET